MLHRIGFNRNLRFITRCLSDKATENDGKTPEVTKQKDEKQKESNVEKIQNLLKSMMADPKISESEYRQKFATAPDVRQRKPKADEVEVKIEKIEDSLTKAAGEVASAIGGDVKQTEAELLSKVLGKINQTSTNLSDLLIGMKVDHSKDSDTTRGERVKNIIVNKTKEQAQSTRYMQKKVPHTRAKQKTMRQATVVDIHGAEPLGIFKTKGDNYGTTLEVWENLKQRELTLATSQPPANYFQKMILWTEQGKVWKFPIDNEQGLEKEQSIPFTEHIFVDAHLEGWCPKRGPVRHFMELVCVGLSKNPFYTAQEKKDHIMWYKEYFESKKELLTEVGAWEQSESNEASKSL